MEITLQPVGSHMAAIVTTEETLFADAQAALDLMATAKYEAAAPIDAMILDKRNIAEDFFVLRTRLAGEVLQKFINYSMKLAIIGDFSGYTSKSLADFIRESNRGKDIFFVGTRAEALRALERAFA